MGLSPQAAGSVVSELSQIVGYPAAVPRELGNCLVWGKPHTPGIGSEVLGTVAQKRTREFSFHRQSPYQPHFTDEDNEAQESHMSRSSSNGSGAGTGPHSLWLSPVLTPVPIIISGDCTRILPTP